MFSLTSVIHRAKGFTGGIADHIVQDQVSALIRDKLWRELSDPVWDATVQQLAEFEPNE